MQIPSDLGVLDAYDNTFSELVVIDQLVPINYTPQRMPNIEHHCVF